MPGRALGIAALSTCTWLALAPACDSSEESRKAHEAADSGADGSMGGALGTGGVGGTSGTGGAAGAPATGGTPAGGSGGAAPSTDAGDASTSQLEPDASSDASADGNATSRDAAAPVVDAGLGPANDAGCRPELTAASLVSYWKADGDFSDSAGRNDGTATGSVTFVTGHAGQAFHFDEGTNEAVTIPYTATLDLKTYSLAAWVRVTSGATDWETLFSKEDHTRGDPWNDRNYGLFVAANTSGCATGVAEAVQTGGALCTSIPVNDGNWHHLASTFDGCTLRAYIDGSLAGSVDSPPPPTGPTQLLYFGKWSVTGTEDLDELRIYKRALDGAAIATLAAQ